LQQWYFEFSDATQSVWYHDLEQALLDVTRALSEPQKPVITQEMIDKIKALGPQSLVEKMALEQGLPLERVGDFFTLLPSRGAAHPSIKLLERIRNILSSIASVKKWGGRVTDAEFQRVLGFGDSFIKKINKKISAGVGHNFDTNSLQKMELKIRSFSEKGYYLARAAVNIYLSKYDSKGRLIHDIGRVFAQHLKKPISTRSLSKLIGRSSSYLQDFITGMHSKTGLPREDIFTHSVLHILVDIFNLKHTKMGIDSWVLEDIKEECFNVVQDFLIDEGKLDKSAKKQFKVIFSVTHTLSKATNSFYSPARLSLEMSQQLYGGDNTQVITTKLVDGSKIDTKQCKWLKRKLRAYILHATPEVLGTIRDINLYYKKSSRARTKYHPRWYDPDIVAEHLYTLLIEQLGFCALTLEPLEDKCKDPLIGWIRHHIDEDTMSIDLDKLAIIISRIHVSSKYLPHKYQAGVSKRDVLRVRARILYNRKVIKDLIDLDKKIIDENDLPLAFRKQFRKQEYIDLFIKRRNEFRQRGEDIFFEPGGFYENFYQLYKNQWFWSTHYLNFLKF